MDGGDVLADTLFFLLLFGVVLAAFTECCEQEKTDECEEGYSAQDAFRITT